MIDTVTAATATQGDCCATDDTSGWTVETHEGRVRNALARAAQRQHAGWDVPVRLPVRKAVAVVPPPAGVTTDDRTQAVDAAIKAGARKVRASMVGSIELLLPEGYDARALYAVGFTRRAFPFLRRVRC